MNYQNIYDRLIEKRKQILLNKKDCYCERHHIIPKCLGGSNNKTNLINLTAREHYIAHCLLVKIAEQKQDKNMYYKMLRAWAAMAMLTKSNYKGMHRNYMKYGSNSIFYENFRYPDFIIDDTIIEIKGWVNDVSLAKINAVKNDYKLKIIMIDKTDIQKYIEYAILKYGEHFYLDLKD